MMDASSALDRMIERTNVPVLGSPDVTEQTAVGDWILLFTGDPTGRPEVADLAVILPEIVKGRNAMVGENVHGHLHFGVIDREAEDALAASMDVFVKPTLVFLRDGAVKGIIPRIKDWAYYEQMLHEYLPLGGAQDGQESELNRRADA